MTPPPPTISYRKRRGVELVLILVAALFGPIGFMMASVNMTGQLPGHLIAVAAGWLGLALIAHFAVRFRAPYADPAILPCVIALNGLGLAMLTRLGMDAPSSVAGSRMGPMQLAWTVMGIALFVLVLFLVRDYRNLQRYSYVLFLLGLAMLLSPLVPGLGVMRGGSRIWIHLGPLSFQPSEIAKITFSLAFASYLAEHRDLLQMVGRKIGPFQIPRARDLMPIMVMWLAAVAVIVFENDLGTALLFFGLFVMMLYIATSQIRWLVISGVLAVIGGAGAYFFTSHVQARFDSWLHPFPRTDATYQMVQSQYGMAWGGLFGRGWGLGRPWDTALAQSDYIASAICEELGLTALMAVIVIYFLIVMRGMRAALGTPDHFGKLLSSGLSFTLALQVFAIIGGITRLLPLTGLTSPFLSQGGSSLVANWVIIALIMQISHAGRAPARKLDNPELDAAADRALIAQVKA